MIDLSNKSRLPPDRLWQPVTARWFCAVLGATLAYAIVRYHLASEVTWVHFPLFILNKAVSLAAVIFLACSYLVGRWIRWHNHDPKIKLVVIKSFLERGYHIAFHAGAYP